MAQDMSDLAASLGVRGGYATLGHSYGAFVVLQHAVDHPGEPRGTVVSSEWPPRAGSAGSTGSWRRSSRRSCVRR